MKHESGSTPIVLYYKIGKPEPWRPKSTVSAIRHYAPVWLAPQMPGATPTIFLSCVCSEVSSRSGSLIAEQIRQVVDDPQIDPALNAKSIRQTLLCFYAGTLMQPMYAGLFKGLSENELDHILSSFSAKQCVPNKGLVNVLSKHTSKPA